MTDKINEKLPLLAKKGYLLMKLMKKKIEIKQPVTEFCSNQAEADIKYSLQQKFSVVVVEIA